MYERLDGAPVFVLYAQFIIAFVSGLLDRSADPRLIEGMYALDCAIAVALLAWAVLNGKVRRRLGIAWDVLNFWPARFHPFAPPCYAHRVVRRNQARFREQLEPVSEGFPRCGTPSRYTAMSISDRQ
jgi:hypothetical protein